MPKHLYLIILLTFVTGLATGVFIFFRVQHQPTEISPDEPEVYDESVFEVLGYQYGGCERTGCTSYRIADDGSYTYLTRAGGVDRRFEDTFSEKRLSELRNMVRSADIESVLKTPYLSTCPASYDGIAYRYEVRRGNERFSLDSCREEVGGEPLFTLLADYFEIFSVTHRNE